MRISHKHKFIWISKPKTGSTSFRKLLTPYSDIWKSREKPFHDHITLRELKVIFADKGWDFDSYHKVVACRNPWNLILSLYAYGRMDVNGKYFFTKSEDYEPDNLMSFSDYMSLDRVWNFFAKRQTLETYAKDENGEVLADFIFSPEEESDKFFEDFKMHTGIELEQDGLKRLNVSSKSSDLMDEVKDVFSQKDIDEKLRALFAWEIEKFNYKNPFS